MENAFPAEKQSLILHQKQVNNQIKANIMKTQNTPMTESTELQGTPKTNQEGPSSMLWQSVFVGGVPGILIGAGVTSAIAKQPEDVEVPAEEANETTAEGSEAAAEIQVAYSVNDDMSFSEAFAAARNEVGPGGAFVWHGHVYGTYRGDDPEWQEMSEEARAEHSQAIIAQVHPTPYTPTENEPEIVPAQEDVEPQPVAQEETTDTQNSEVDVHLVDIVQGQAEDGTIVTAGVGHVNGHYAEFVDSDGDGEVDTVLLDSNDNQVLDEGEVHPVPGIGITIDDMVAEVQSNNAAAVDDAIYGDMPDYSNDADTSSFC